MKKSRKTEIKWEDLPRETREITSFFHLIIEETIESMNVEFTPTYIRCFKKNCHGIIETAMHENMKDICWRCNNCTNSGIIKNVFGD